MEEDSRHEEEKQVEVDDEVRGTITGLLDKLSGVMKDQNGAIEDLLGFCEHRQVGLINRILVEKSSDNPLGCFTRLLG